MEKEKIEIGVSNCGSPDYTPIEYEFDENVKTMVPKLGKTYNRFKMIQASKNSTDITAIIKRAQAGDLTVLNVKQGVYADVSDVPDNLNDINQFNSNLINNFASLDPKVRALFGNDFTKFKNAVADGSYADVINKAFMPKKEENNDVKEDKE